MYLWRRLAAPRWLFANEAPLRARARERLAIIEHLPRKNLILEVVCGSQAEAQALRRQFGGRIEKLPRDWLKRFSAPPQPMLLKIGKRLLISNVGGTSASRRSPRQGASHIVIPAGAAFGTGEHATTAMSLRFLEQITRGIKRGWSVADLGTGSGILALAAHRFGAGRIYAVDNDASAIATAKENARANKIKEIDFRVADARRWRPRGKVDIVVANLFSELLIEALPNVCRYLATDGRLVLSGVLRQQERRVIRALRANGMAVDRVRRRGKWIAVLAARVQGVFRLKTS